MIHLNTYPNRLICTVLEEMRKLYEARNFSSFLGLIEEAQSMANRMEAALRDKSDYEEWMENFKALKKEIKDLIAKKDKLNREIRDLESEVKELKGDKN